MGAGRKDSGRRLFLCRMWKERDFRNGKPVEFARELLVSELFGFGKIEGVHYERLLDELIFGTARAVVNAVGLFDFFGHGDTSDFKSGRIVWVFHTRILPCVR